MPVLTKKRAIIAAGVLVLAVSVPVVVDGVMDNKSCAAAWEWHGKQAAYQEGINPDNATFHHNKTDAYAAMIGERCPDWKEWKEPPQ